MRLLLSLALILITTPDAHSEALQHTVKTDPARVVVHVHPDHAVTVAFKARIVRIHIPPVRRLTVRHEAGVLVIHPERHREAWGSVHVLTAAGVVILDIRGVKSAADVHPAIIIEPAGHDGVFRTAVAATAREIADEETRELREEIEALKEALARSQEKIRTASLGYEAAQRDELKDYLSGPRCTPLPPETPDEGIRIEHSDWLVIGARRLAIFEVTNTGYEPYPVADFRIWGHRARRDHAGARLIGDDDAVPHSVIALIPPRMRVRGIARIMDPELVGPEIVYAMATEGGKQPIRSQPARTWDLTPLLEDPPPPPDPEEGVVTVSVKGTYGAIWLGDGAGLDRSQATSLKGLGVGISYGFNRYIALEADIMGATTGEARFADATWNEMQGDLARSAWLGRAQFGGALRVGSDWYQPVVRAGVGLQGASHSAYHDVNGVRMDGPDVGFEVEPYWTAGAGLDLRAGPLTAGIGLSFLSATRGDTLSVSAGAHVGVRWN